MRTTLTIDPDVERLIHEAMHRRRESLKSIVNNALRAGLGSRSASGEQKPFRVKPFSLGLRTGIDPSRFNHLADEVEDEAMIKKMSKRDSS